MSRLVDIEDVKDLINGLDSLPWEEEVDDLLKGLPTIEAVPVVHGEWKFDMSGAGHYYCSICGGRGDFYGKYNFCPTCGANMEV